jgi:hypothetical protein
MVLGRPARITVRSDGPEPLELARNRMTELDHRWRPGGADSELARLGSCPGVAVWVSDDTVLLARLAARRPETAGCVYVDASHNLVGLLVELPQSLIDLAAALAVELVFAELSTAGASVEVGGYRRQAGES